MDVNCFAQKFGPLIDGIVSARALADPQLFLPSLLLGASFEGWLSFESRFALEQQRSGFDLADPRCWIGNEYQKVDFGIVRYDDPQHQTGEAWDVAVEFKVIYNNKNWEDQVESVRSDLFPAKYERSGKASVVTAERQLAAVAIVRADVTSNKHQRLDDRHFGWESRVRAKLGIPSEVTQLWESPTPFVADHPYLDPGTKAILRFLLLAPAGT